MIGILITGGAIFGSSYKVTSPTILAPWPRARLLAIGLLWTWCIRARVSAHTQLADLSAETAT